MSAASSGTRPGAADPQPVLEITVVGSGPAAPQPDTPGSGLLVRAGDDHLLVDCGTGTASRLRTILDPRALRAVVVSHLHADHYLDLVALRYHWPWAGQPEGRLRVLLPPGGEARLAALAEAISESRSFFSQAFDVREYDPGRELCVGALRLAFIPGRHYIPAWGVSVVGPAGERFVYSSDTGPNPDLAEAARGADLLAIEATLEDVAEDVEERGHLTLDEALATARRAGLDRVLITHYPSERRAAMAAATRGHRPRVVLARPGLRLAVRAGQEDRAARTGGQARDEEGVAGGGS